MPYDYTEAPPSRDTMELMPRDTVVTLVFHIRPGNVGEDGMLTRNADGDCEMLNAEFTIADGKHKGRKIWQYFVLDGTKPGHVQAAEISRSTLRAILDSALGLKPDDVSPQARAARTVSLKQFEGMTFIGKIGIERGGPKKDKAGMLTGENWPDKNILAAVITPDKKDWKPVEQPPPFDGGGGTRAAAPSSAAAPIARPGWAS
jgi:hypothetical protein